MKTSILQSMLARNKEVIYYLHLDQQMNKEAIKKISIAIKSYDIALHTSDYYYNHVYSKNCLLKDIQKNSKSLKQLAEIQKEIKIEIKRNDSRDSYLLMLAKRGD